MGQWPSLCAHSVGIAPRRKGSKTWMGSAWEVTALCQGSILCISHYCQQAQIPALRELLTQDSLLGPPLCPCTAQGILSWCSPPGHPSPGHAQALCQQPSPSPHCTQPPQLNWGQSPEAVGNSLVVVVVVVVFVWNTLNELKGPLQRCSISVNYAKWRFEVFQKSQRKTGRRF